MKSIGLNQVNKCNTNIRQYSDSLWRELRKCRWKGSGTNKKHPYSGYEKETRDYVSVYGQSEFESYLKEDPINYFNPVNPPLLDMAIDFEKLAKRQLSPIEYKVFNLHFKVGLTQMEIADTLGVCQSTVCKALKAMRQSFKDHLVD